MLGGENIAHKLNKSASKSIKVVGNGVIKVSDIDKDTLSKYRASAKHFVERDAQAVTAASDSRRN